MPWNKGKMLEAKRIKQMTLACRLTLFTNRSYLNIEFASESLHETSNTVVNGKKYNTGGGVTTCMFISIILSYKNYL